MHSLYTYNNKECPVLDRDGVQERQDIPDGSDYPGEGPTYDTMNPGNSVTILDTWERKNMFYI